MSNLMLYLFYLSLFQKQQSKPVVKGSKYQTLPGKLPRPLQNGEQGMYNSPDGCGMSDNDDSSVPGLSMYLCLSHRENPHCLRDWNTAWDRICYARAMQHDVHVVQLGNAVLLFFFNKYQKYSHSSQQSEGSV